MRKIKNISTYLQEKILGQFNGLKKVIMCEKHNYTVNYLSVFDHWLNEEEAKVLINDNLDYDNRLHRFCSFLVEEYDTYAVRRRGRYKNKIVLSSFVNDEMATSYVAPLNFMLPMKFRFILLVPELKLIYLEGSDYTHFLYSEDMDSVKSSLNEVAQKNNLFFLD